MQLMNVLMGMLADSGEIVLRTDNHKPINPLKRARSIIIVPQSQYNAIYQLLKIFFLGLHQGEYRIDWTIARSKAKEMLDKLEVDIRSQAS